jgi:hypothetical protein
MTMTRKEVRSMPLMFFVTSLFPSFLFTKEDIGTNDEQTVYICDLSA